MDDIANMICHIPLFSIQKNMIKIAENNVSTTGSAYKYSSVQVKYPTLYVSSSLFQQNLNL